ncbi:ATP-dependent DNA helicase, partial [Actinomyces sp. MRS3W]|nr:ATP-dependent DNA helicase [Actinomyces sp. MRS3W]
AVGAGIGPIAVIAQQPGPIAAVLGDEPTLAAAMQAPDGDILRSRVAVMEPTTAKGLEFDVVVLVDPATIGQVSPGDLYVAMTRPTRRLRVISRVPLPAGLTSTPENS